MSFRDLLTFRVSLVLLLAACPGPLAGLDDAGTAVDGGGPSNDGGSGDDAGAFDAGAIDAGGTRPDAGPLDAGLSEPDSGLDAGADDAGAPDAGPPDAGQPIPLVDAGPADTAIVIGATPGSAVPDDFLGLSVEWSHVTDYLGDGQGHLRPEVVNLLGAFAAEGHQVVLRIGGNSEDTAWWNPSAAPNPSGVTVSIGAEHLATLAALHAATGARFVLGLNLARLDPMNAAALAQASLAALGTGVLAFELGNEPDLYFYTGHRSLLYSPLAYQADVDSYFPLLGQAVGNQALIAGPAVYGTTWFSNLAGFLAAEQGRYGLVTAHRYPFNVCLTTIGGPTIASLFTDVATTQYATTFAPVVQTAKQAGQGLRVAEMNSVSCGGLPGVSDVYAAGLWGADAMFQLASVGVAGVNLHGPSHYAVFDFTTGGALEVRGLYYAMRLFSLATAQHGRPLPVTVQAGWQVRAWAYVGADGATRVAVINEDPTRTSQVSVSVGPTARRATERRLTAASLDATTAITFGGQTWSTSLDGLPVGSAVEVPVPVQSGTSELRFTLGPGSATLLTVP